MKKLFFLIFFLTGCKGDFIIDNAESIYAPHTEIISESCHKCGFCILPGGYQLSCFCPGIRQVEVQVIPYIGHYEKEPNIQITKERIEILREISSCD